MGSPVPWQSAKAGGARPRLVVSCCLATYQPSKRLGDCPAFPIARRDSGPSAAGRCSVLLWENLRMREARRARRRTDLAALEQLEGRQLMAYSSLGFSLPDITVSGSAGPVASWGGSLTVNVFLQNTGASTINEPLALAPASQIQTGPDGQAVPPYATNSSADVPAQAVSIILTPRRNSIAGAIQIGTLDAPAFSQNDVEQVPVTLTLPSRPARFPLSGQFFIRIIADVNNAVVESNNSNNFSPPIPIRINNQPLPTLRTTALDVPPSLRPGDTIAPTFQIANFGTANPSAQGPLEVALVASVSPDFNLGSSIVALYTFPNGIPPQSNQP